MTLEHSMEFWATLRRLCSREYLISSSQQPLLMNKFILLHLGRQHRKTKIYRKNSTWPSSEVGMANLARRHIAKTVQTVFST